MSQTHKHRDKQRDRRNCHSKTTLCTLMHGTNKRNTESVQCMAVQLKRFVMKTTLQNCHYLIWSSLNCNKGNYLTILQLHTFYYCTTSLKKTPLDVPIIARMFKEALHRFTRQNITHQTFNQFDVAVTTLIHQIYTISRLWTSNTTIVTEVQSACASE